MAVTQVIELPLAEQLPVEQLGACCAPLTEAPISAEDAELAARVFKALADPARVRLLSTIAAGDPDGTCVCDLNEAVDLAQRQGDHPRRVGAAQHAGAADGAAAADDQSPPRHRAPSCTDAWIPEFLHSTAQPLHYSPDG